MHPGIPFIALYYKHATIYLFIATNPSIVSSASFPQIIYASILDRFLMYTSSLCQSLYPSPQPFLYFYYEFVYMWLIIVKSSVFPSSEPTDMGREILPQTRMHQVHPVPPRPSQVSRRSSGKPTFLLRVIVKISSLFFLIFCLLSRLRFLFSVVVLLFITIDVMNCVLAEDSRVWFHR